MLQKSSTTTRPVWSASRHVFPSTKGISIAGAGWSHRPNVSSPAPGGITATGFSAPGFARGEYQQLAPKLNELGYNCLAIDQRSGRGVNGVTNETNKAAKDAGLPTAYADAYPDLEAALNYLVEQYHPKQLFAWGSSYSASLVLILAAEHPQEVQAALAFSPGEYFSFHDLQISDYAAKITQPVFITSAKSEEQAWRGIANSVSSAGSVFFVPQGSGVHGSSALLESTKNNAEYWTAVEGFLQSLTLS